jgi:hypothetical protein
MAITKIVDLQVNSNIDQTTQDVKQLNTAIQSVDKSADKVGNSLSKAGAAGNSFGAIKNMVTELNPALAGAEKGFGAVLTQMWAMVANPIGAVIAALVLGLTALYKAFTSTDEGADKLEQMMSGLSNVMVVIRDRFLKFGEALAKFFSGDFSGAVKDAKSAISGVGDEIAAEFKKGAEAAKLLQEVGDAMRDLKVARAELNKNLAESKELLSDENATYAQKKKAIEEIRKGEAEYTKDALENARKTLRAAQLNKKASADERADAIADAKAEILNLEAESAQILRSANKQQKQLNAQMAAEQKANQEAELARQKAILDKRSEYLKGTLEYEDSLLKASYKSRQVADENELKWNSAKIKAEREKDIEAANTRAATNLAIANSEKFSFDQRLAAVASREEMESQMVFKNEADRTKFKEENAKAREEIDKAEAAAKMKMLSAIGSALNTASELAGKNTSAGKALAIAATTIDTIQSGVSAFKGMVAAVPGPVGIGLGVVAAAGALASGIASVKKIVAVKVPGGGGGSVPSVGSAPTAGGAGGSATPNFNVVGNSGVNQLAGIMATKDQTPVKAYVVPSDVTTGQSLDRNIIRNASLG